MRLEEYDTVRTIHMNPKDVAPPAHTLYGYSRGRWEGTTHSWLESLVKAHVGDGLAADFYREIAEWLDPVTRDLVVDVLADTGHSSFAVREVRSACQADPRLTGALALWGRRLLGEAITQAQYVVADHDDSGQPSSSPVRETSPASRPCSGACRMGHTGRMKSLILA